MNVQGFTSPIAQRARFAGVQQQRPVKFSGDADDKKLSPEQEAGIEKAVDNFLTDRVKLPNSALHTLETLQKETGLDADRLLTLASTFGEPVRYFDFFTSKTEKKPIQAALIPDAQLQALKDAYGYKLGNLSEDELTAWKKTNLKTLQPGAQSKGKFSDYVKSGKTFAFKDARPRDTAEKIYFALIGGLFTLGIGWVIQDHRVKKGDNKRVVQGLDILSQAFEARRKDPSLKLVTFMSGEDYDDKFKPNGKKVIYLTPLDLEPKP
jgi:hypothetical protein